jgi:hypothetical protein
MRNLCLPSGISGVLLAADKPAEPDPASREGAVVMIGRLNGKKEGMSTDAYVSPTITFVRGWRGRGSAHNYRTYFAGILRRKSSYAWRAS